MGSSTQPCSRLENPPELLRYVELSTYHYYDATRLTINEPTPHHEIFRELLIFCPQVYKHSNPIFTSRFMIREAYLIYADVLRWGIASLNVTSHLLRHKIESFHLNDPSLRTFHAIMMKDLLGFKDWAMY